MVKVNLGRGGGRLEYFFGSFFIASASFCGEGLMEIADFKKIHNYSPIPDLNFDFILYNLFEIIVAVIISSNCFVTHC